MKQYSFAGNMKNQRENKYLEVSNMDMDTTNDIKTSTNNDAHLSLFNATSHQIWCPFKAKVTRQALISKETVMTSPIFQSIHSDLVRPSLPNS